MIAFDEGMEAAVRESFSCFFFRETPNGLVIVPVNDPLVSGCWTDAEIDHQIARLKAELDDVALLMKEKLPAARANPLFGEHLEDTGDSKGSNAPPT